MKSYMSALAVLFSLSLCAQKKDTSGYHPFSIGVTLTSVPVEAVSGTDTTFRSALSVAPFLELRSKSGWGIVYSPSYVSASASSGIYMHTLSAGYERYGEKKMDVAFYYAHYFFTNATAVPYSPLSNEASLFLNYTHSWLRPIVAASVGFGKDTTGGGSSAVHDIGVALGVNHGFTWEGSGLISSFELTPSVLVNGATNGYFSFLSTSAYLSHSGKFIRYVKKVRGGASSGRNPKASTGMPSFELSNAELALEAEVEMGSFSIRPGGSLFLPVSAGTDNAPFGYGQLTFQYHF